MGEGGGLSLYTGAYVLIPEYPGYGLLEDFRSNIGGINEVAYAALRYAIEQLQFKSKRIVIFGRSIGTGPACTLAAASTAPKIPERPHLAPVGGLILVAPFVSLRKLVGIHVPLATDLVEDAWVNMTNLQAIGDTPLLIIHGKDDDVIPHSHGQLLYKNAPSALKAGFFPDRLSHNHWNSKESLMTIRRFFQVRVEGMTPAKAAAADCTFRASRSEDIGTEGDEDPSDLSVLRDFISGLGYDDMPDVAIVNLLEGLENSSSADLSSRACQSLGNNDNAADSMVVELQAQGAFSRMLRTADLGSKHEKRLLDDILRSSRRAHRELSRLDRSPQGGTKGDVRRRD